MSGHQTRGALSPCEEVGFILGQGESLRGSRGRLMVLKHPASCKECGTRQDEGTIRTVVLGIELECNLGAQNVLECISLATGRWQ